MPDFDPFKGQGQTNGLTNVLTASTSGLEGYFNMGKKDKYELELRGSASYNTNKSSLQAHAPQDYWVYLLSPSAAVFLPARVELHTNVNYTIRQKTAAFNADLNVFLWNAWIGKYLLKKDALLIKLAANDLLNQNKGVTRNIAGNFISQNTFSTVRQFFLLSLVWSFSGTGGVATGSPAAGK